MHARTFVVGTAVGAAAMYWLDPQAGARRRARSKQRATHVTHEAEHAVGVLTRDLVHREEGLLAALAHWIRPRAVSDEVLKERVRSRLGRFCSHPSAIEVECRDGHVALRGPIVLSEHTRVLRGIGRVSGVTSVLDALAPIAEPEHVSALQGGRPRPGPTIDILQDTWAPTTRALAATAGLLLLVRGLRHRTLAGLGSDVAGAALLVRAAGTRGRARYTTLDGRPAVTIRKTLHIRARTEEVFALFNKPEVFPRFMTHVRAVRRDGDRHSHWKVTGPLGTSFEWGAEITELEPDRLIAWRSTAGSDIGNAGRITFTPSGDGKTDVQVSLSYHPPGGIVGHSVATLLGVGPKKQLDDDLLRLKSLLETGKATGLGEPVTREELV